MNASNTGADTADDGSRLRILNVRDGDTVAGDAEVAVSIALGRIYGEELTLYLDGEDYGSARVFPQESDSQGDATFNIQTYWHANGQHRIEVLDSQGNLQPRSVIFHNIISQVDLRSFLDVEPQAGEVEPLEGAEFPYHITAVLSPPQSWRVELEGIDDSLVTRFAGQGGNIDCYWDGTDRSGQVATSSPYLVTMTALESDVTIAVGFINNLT